MKIIEPGTMFEAPLPNGRFAYGYVSFDNDKFLLLNIFDHLSTQQNDFDAAVKKPINIRDLLEERSRFMRMKGVVENGWLWYLKRRKMAPEILAPKYDFIAGSSTVSNIYTEEIIGPVTPADEIRYPSWSLEHTSFLGLFVQGRLEGKSVVLIDRVKVDGVVIEPARFELRPDTAFDGLEPYEFHSLADA